MEMIQVPHGSRSGLVSAVRLILSRSHTKQTVTSFTSQDYGPPISFNPAEVILNLTRLALVHLPTGVMTQPSMQFTRLGCLLSGMEIFVNPIPLAGMI
jgi:hypothetical protein